MADRIDLGRTSVNLEKLLRLCKRRGRILVLMQNNPDPDAIASAMAIRTLVRHKLHKRVTLGYGGILGRAENRAMVHELRVDTHRVTPDDLERYTTLCLVDTQPRTGNNALFTSRQADIVIDHHILTKKQVHRADLMDVRPEYGATSSILYEYLAASETPIDEDLATALYYGIESDTQVLGREACEVDIEVFQALVGLANMRKVARIRRAPLGPDYFNTLRSSLSNALVAGSTVVSLVRDAQNPDIFAEMAELLLRFENARTAVCYGPCNNMIYLSARAGDARGNVAMRMKRVVSRLGTGGGHRSMAGGQVPTTTDIDKRLKTIHQRILKHFAHQKECKPLLLPEDAKDREAGNE